MGNKKPEKNINSKPLLGTTDEVMSNLSEHFGNTAAITPIDQKMIDSAKKAKNKQQKEKKKKQKNIKNLKPKKQAGIMKQQEIDVSDNVPDEISGEEFDNFFQTEVIGKIVEPPPPPSEPEIEYTAREPFYDLNTYLEQQGFQAPNPDEYDMYMQGTTAFEYEALNREADQKSNNKDSAQPLEHFGKPQEFEQPKQQLDFKQRIKLFSRRVNLTNILSAVGIFLIVATISTVAVLMIREIRGTIIEVGTATPTLQNSAGVVKIDTQGNNNGLGEMVFMRASSAEEDLTITFTDSNGDVITGYPFSVDVIDIEGERENHVDQDMDGEIYIETIPSGGYSIEYVPNSDAAQPNANTYLAARTVSVNVAPKVEYVPIEYVPIVESDASTEQEDGGRPNGGAPSTPEPTPEPTPVTTPDPFVDTVEFVETGSEQKSTSSEVITALYFIPDLYTPPMVTETPAATETPAVTETPSETPQSSDDSTQQTAFTFDMISVRAMTYATSSKVLTLSAALDPQKVYLKNPDGTPTDIEALIDPVTGYLIGAQRTGSDGSISSVEIFDNSDPRDMLKDESGNYLYLVTKSEQKETIETVETIYYGWQTLDGKTYYFNKDGVKVTGEQVIQGVKYVFDTEGVMLSSTTPTPAPTAVPTAVPTPTMPTDGSNIGVDVSEWQENIDWVKVKESGVNYAILRVGFRGYGSGRIVEDASFRENVVAAKAAGLKVGVYFFSCALNTQEAVEEASAVLNMIAGYGIDYPIVIDIETIEGSTDRANTFNYMSANERTKIAIAFCETIKSAGYTPMVYSFKSWLEHGMYASELEQYLIWLAHIGVSQTSYAGRYDMWQYTWTGTVPGISGGVDMNRSYLGY